jgi:hypothetical protein
MKMQPPNTENCDYENHPLITTGNGDLRGDHLSFHKGSFHKEAVIRDELRTLHTKIQKQHLLDEKELMGILDETKIAFEERGMEEAIGL